MNLVTIIADDDDIVIFLHRIMLEDSGLCSNPISVENGQLALDYIVSHQSKDTSFLVFLDINMPVFSGWDFLNAIQALPFTHQVFVVMVTSSLDSADKEKANHYSQVIDFVEKPLNEDICIQIKNLPEIQQCLNASTAS